jgi:hypothetical protein
MRCRAVRTVLVLNLAVKRLPIRVPLAGWLVLSCALAWSSGARAQAVEVVGRDSCVTEAAITAAMKRYAARLERDPGLRARVSPSAQSLSFEVLRDDAVLAERAFETLPRRCVERVRAVAIAIALAFESVRARELEQAAAVPVTAPQGTAAPASAIEPANRPSNLEPKPAAEKEPEKEPAEKKPAEERPSEEAKDGSEPEPDRDAPTLVIEAGAGVLVGVLPEPALTLALGVGLPLGRVLRLELTGLASPGVTTVLADGVVDAQLFGGQGALCAGLPWGVLRVAGCAGVAAAIVPATGSDFAVSGRSTTTGWTAGLVAATLDLRLAGPLSLRASAELLGSLVRPALEARIDGETRDATPSVLAGLLSMHVLWAVP